MDGGEVLSEKDDVVKYEHDEITCKDIFSLRDSSWESIPAVMPSVQWDSLLFLSYRSNLFYW